MSIRSKSVIAFCVVASTAVPALALDVTAPPLTVKAGSTIRLYGVFDCVHGSAPMTAGRADHGKVTVREGTINRCGNPKQPISELYYTPDPGYRGPDEAKIYRGSAYTLRKIMVK